MGQSGQRSSGPEAPPELMTTVGDPAGPNLTPRAWRKSSANLLPRKRRSGFSWDKQIQHFKATCWLLTAVCIQMPANSLPWLNPAGKPVGFYCPPRECVSQSWTLARFTSEPASQSSVRLGNDPWHLAIPDGQTSPLETAS